MIDMLTQSLHKAAFLPAYAVMKGSVAQNLNR
ncbi:hypothetical protein Pat9b_5613 (plasmid) [Pantoea sp. At-9b]|nr:hypothetical protein Pat9b_5613 [Pantoea sp. At-9b]